MNELTKAILASAVRHALTALAGSLVIVGAIHAEDAASFVSIGSGLVIYGISFTWAWFQKKATI